MKIANKVIVVTGAGSGIGRELSLNLLSKNARVIGVDLHEEALLETMKLAGVGNDRFMVKVLNITDKVNVDALPNEVIAHFGQIDGLINNAGIIQKFILVNDLEIEDIKRVMEVNFFGTVYLTKAFLPHFLLRPEAHIVNVSSMGGFIPFPKQTIYGAAKAAVKIFTEGLYAELKNTNVKVTVVHPGAVATNITENSGVGRPNMDDPKAAKKAAKMTLPAPKAAEIIIDGMERNKYRVLVGKDANMLDKLYRLNPRFATNFIGKMMAKAGI